MPAPAPRPAPAALTTDDALFLDVDGTLVGFADHPDKVVIDAGLKHLLAGVSTRLGGALALVSGRPLSQLRTLFAPLPLAMAGLHGAQLCADGLPLADTGAPAWMSLLHPHAMQFARAHPGVWLEDKQHALALHWRNAPWHAAAATAFAQAQLPLLDGVRLQPGNQVIEFVGADHDKGHAVQVLMRQQAFAGRRAVFVGDDLTDEAGFAAAQALGGIGVLVGARAHSAACTALPGVDAVHAWLRTALD